MINHRFVPVCALILLTASAGESRAAPAQSAENPPSRTVRFDDLDLGTARGVRTLYLRIRDAARSVCGVYERAETLFPSAPFDACVQKAMQSAVAAAEVPALAAYYEERRARAARPFFRIAAR
jgi:UrcA family protein